MRCWHFWQIPNERKRWDVRGAITHAHIMMPAPVSCMASNSYWSIALRVAFDISSMRGRKTGIGVYAEQLLDALHRYTPQVETIALQDGAGENQRTDQRMLREQLALPRLAEKSHADLFHLTGFAAPLRSRVTRA